MEEETAAAVPTEVYHFGPKGHDVSDVILLVDGAELHVNKMFLATRSPVFYVLFFGDFIENGQDRVVIEADLLAFRHLTEIFYYGSIETKRNSFIYCHFPKAPENHRRKCKNAEFQQKLWIRTVNLMELADQFDVFDLVSRSLQNMFLRHGCSNMKKCFKEGVRQLVALNYDMKEFKKFKKAYNSALAGALKNLKPISPHLSMDFEALKWIFPGSQGPISEIIGPGVYHFGNENLSDVTLLVGDGVEFKIHRTTLACRSDYFHSLLYPDGTQGHKAGKVKIEEDPDAVWEVLHFMYEGRLGNRNGRYTVCWNPDEHFCFNEKQVQGYWMRSSARPSARRGVSTV